MMANVGFNGTHQKIVFDVTDRFYQLGNARQKVMVTQSALDAAKTVEQAAQARFDNGLATKPELLQAQQQSAQSNFDVQASLGAESDARVALIESIGLLPTVSLKVADLPEQSDRGRQTADSVGELTTKALSQRPDLVAKLANVRAKEQGILKIRAEYYPKVTLDAHVSETELDVSIANSDFFGGARPTLAFSSTLRCRSSMDSRAGTNWTWQRPICIKLRTNLLERATLLREMYGRRTPVTEPRLRNRTRPKNY